MRISNLLIYSVFLILFASLSGCHSTPSFRFGTYSEAEKLYKKREYRKAIEKYEEYARENPEGNMAVIASYYMAKSYESLGETQKARELYEKIIRDHPSLIWADYSKNQLKELESVSS